jgi:hypothetical protein
MHTSRQAYQSMTSLGRAKITSQLETKCKQNENKQLNCDLNGMSDNKAIITFRARSAFPTHVSSQVLMVEKFELQK